jgi:hypothetical protein
VDFADILSRTAGIHDLLEIYLVRTRVPRE